MISKYVYSIFRCHQNIVIPFFGWHQWHLKIFKDTESPIPKLSPFVGSVFVSPKLTALHDVLFHRPKYRSSMIEFPTQQQFWSVARHIWIDLLPMMAMTPSKKMEYLNLRFWEASQWQKTPQIRSHSTNWTQGNDFPLISWKYVTITWF